MRTGKFIKKWLFSANLICVVGLLTTAYAQKPFIETGMHGHRDIDLIRAITDTLDDQFDSATATMYGSPNGGFVGGNSGYGETAKAQQFVVNAAGAYYVEGFIYWFGYKAMESLPADSSYLNLKFWNNNYISTIGSINFKIPYSIFDSTALLIDTLVADTMFAGGINVWMLPTPQYVTDDYSAGFTMEHLHYKDTISLMTTTDGDPPSTLLSWEKWNNTWNLIDYAWGLDIDFAIFPLVDLTGIGIEESPFVQGLRYSLFPNPASDWMNVDMELKQKGDYAVTIHDLSGKLIKAQNLGYLSPGRVSTSIDVFELPSGNYILSLTDGKKGLSQQFVKN